MSTECPLCIERITPSKIAACPYCDYTTCKSCFVTYLQNSVDDASCINPSCKHLFSREDIIRVVNKTFVNGEYKRIRERLLNDREMSMMPATQPFVVQERQRRSNEQLVRRMQEERQKLKRQIHELDRSIRAVWNTSVPVSVEERRAFVHKCGQDGCRGFLSTAWKCTVCMGYTCADCGVYKGLDRDAPHVCDDNDKASMTLIKNECRRCPGCAQYIHRISGCDQMWCTACHTAFSWRTGAKVNGTIHNPHFYTFQREHNNANREAADIPCGGRPSVHELFQVVPTSHPARNYLGLMHRLINHIDLIETHRYPTDMAERDNRDLRIQYSLGELSDIWFQRQLQQREKNREKRRDIGYILRMLVDTSGDMMRAACISRDIDAMIADLHAVVAYANREMESVSRRYNCVVPIVNEETGHLRTQRF